MRAVRLSAALVVALALADCGGDGGSARDTRGDAGASPGGTLEILSFIDVDSVDPARTYSVGGYSVVLQVHRPLYAFTSGREAVPDLAQGPPRVAPDGRTVSVRIRDGVRFGAPVEREVVAADVRNAIERGFRPSVATPYATQYFGDLVGVDAFRSGRAPHVAGIEVLGDRRLRFRLRRPRGQILAGALALPLTAPVPREVSDRADRGRSSTYFRHAVPTGPYRVESFRPGTRTVLVRNPEWRPQGDFRRALPDRVVWSPRGELAVAARQVLEGRGRMLGPGPPPPPAILRDIARGRYEGRTGFVETMGTLVYAFDTSRPPLDDVDVRRAILAGSDRRALQLSFGGEGAGPVATHFLPPILPGFEEAGGAAGPGSDFLASPSGDRELAASYLRRAGFRSGRFDGPPIDVMSPVGLAVGQVFADQLERLGFRVNLQELDAGAAFTRCGQPATKAHICFMPWGGDFFDPETFLAPVLDPAVLNPDFTLNVAELRDPRLTRAIERGKSLVDPRERARAWGEVDRAAVDLAAALPILWQRNALLRSRDVRAGVSPWLAGWDLSTAGLVR